MLWFNTSGFMKLQFTKQFGWITATWHKEFPNQPCLIKSSSSG